MKIIHTSGKRKTAVARATLKEGSGVVRIDGMLLDVYHPKLYRMKIREPLLLAGDAANKVNITVKVHGGGPNAQSEAARLAIARALARHSKRLEEVFSKYDRHLLVADVRYKETHKPGCHGKARAHRQKSYR